MISGRQVSYIEKAIDIYSRKGAKPAKGKKCNSAISGDKKIYFIFAFFAPLREKILQTTK